MANLTKEERERRAVADDAANPRVPVSPVSTERDEPTTDAAGGLPVGTPGTVDPLPAEKRVVENLEAAKKVPSFPVRLKRGYYPMDGGAKLSEGKEIELPIEEARRLIEAGIAVRNDEVRPV